MKIRGILLCILSAFFPIIVSGQEPEEDWTHHLIPLEQRSFDFQTVAKGAAPEHQFILRNPLQEPLRIASIISSCTCTTAEYDPGKTVLQTYEEFVLTAKLRGDLYDGQRNATLTIAIDEPNRAELQLNIRGDIRLDLKTTPTSIDFGNVKPEEESSRTVTVTYSGPNSQWRVIEARCDNKFISTNITVDSQDIGQKVFKVTALLNKSAPRGNVNGIIFLITNDAFSRREIPIPFKATIGTVLNVSPPTLFFGALTPETPSQPKMAILSSSVPFRITDISCDNPAVEVDFDPESQAKNRIFLPLLYRNPAEGEGAPKNGIMQAAVTVTTDVPGLTHTFYVTASVKSDAE